MSILRIMTYALKRGAADIAVAAQLIRSQRPELVYLQHVRQESVASLAEETGLQAFGGEGDCAFLGCQPLSAVRYHRLGMGGECLRADLTLAEKRIHLFNIQLATDPALRGQQIAKLFGDDLLGAVLPCAKLVAGDFSLPLWGGGQWLLRQRLKKAAHPVWGANYPAMLPLWPRDRFYLSGPIRALAGQVISSPELRRASCHLPLVATMELTDTRIYLKIPEVSDRRMRPAEG